MRILYVSQGLTPHDIKFLTSLAKTAHQVYFLCLTPGLVSASLPGAITEIKLPPAETLLAGLQDCIDQVAPDVIHAGPLHTVANHVAKLGFPNLVAVSWGYDLLMEVDQNPASREAILHVLNACKMLICDCNASRQKAIQLGIAPQKIVTFPWGVDLTHFAPAVSSALRQELQWDDQFILLSTRSWEPLYGVTLLAQAFVDVAKIVPTARLLLVGSGSQEAEIRTILSQGQVEDKVHFAGRVNLPELPRYYQAADLYISTSHVDGSSVSLMEALACGTPALVSDIVGNQEWVTPGIQGWTFKDNDVSDLTKKILSVIQQTDQLPYIARQARAQAVARADWQAHFPQLLKAYEKANGMAAKLGIGTVQFGLDYGISNKTGKTSRQEAKTILELAAELGIDMLDTAAAYGDSECVLGEALTSSHDFSIVTKVPAASTPDALEQHFMSSLERLKQPFLYGLLMHNPDDLLGQDGPQLMDRMLTLKAKGLVKKIGISVYTPEQVTQVLARFPIDLIQIPLNIFDQRFLQNNFLAELKQLGIEIHVRSAFLQGLLLMEADANLQPYFAPFKTHIENYHAERKRLGFNPLQAALGFVLSVKEVDRVVIGVNNAEQLREICKQAVVVDKKFFNSFINHDVKLINPSYWNK